MLKSFATVAFSLVLLAGCGTSSGGSGSAEAPAPPSAKCGCKAVAGNCGCVHCKGGTDDPTKCTCTSHTKDGCACACKGVARNCLCGHCATGGGKCNCSK